MVELDVVACELEKRWANSKVKETWKKWTRELFPGDELFLANMYYIRDKRNPTKQTSSLWTREVNNYFKVFKLDVYSWDAPLTSFDFLHVHEFRPLDRTKVFTTVDVLDWWGHSYVERRQYPEILKKVRAARE
jgi:hypothetical protein